MLQAVYGLQHWGALGLVWELASGGTSADEDLGWLKEWWSIVDMLLAAGADVSGKVTSGFVI